jgi:glycosyltransferase involved in cell wall biosynthesis
MSPPGPYCMKSISILLPIYCEEEGLPALFQAMDKVATGQPGYFWEFILVNDGSRDHSIDVLRAQAAKDPRYRVVDLSRNFGKEVALSAGLPYASGDAVICMDADLQHPPSYIPQMIAEWENGADVVEMIRTESENEPIARKIGSRVFYFLLKAISDTEILSKTTDFRLLDRRVVDALQTIEERHRMFRGLVDWLGFRKVRLPFTASARQHGESVYSYAKLINLALNSFIGHSSIPLKLIGVLGGVITFVGMLLFVFMAGATLIDRHWFSFTGLAFAVVINTVLIGIVLLALGLMSLYISKIYAETQNRPLFVVREVLNAKPRS